MKLMDGCGQAGTALLQPQEPEGLFVHFAANPSALTLKRGHHKAQGRCR